MAIWAIIDHGHDKGFWDGLETYMDYYADNGYRSFEKIPWHIRKRYKRYEVTRCGGSQRWFYDRDEAENYIKTQGERYAGL